MAAPRLSAVLRVKRDRASRAFPDAGHVLAAARELWAGRVQLLARQSPPECGVRPAARCLLTAVAARAVPRVETAPKGVAGGRADRVAGRDDRRRAAGIHPVPAWHIRSPRLRVTRKRSPSRSRRWSPTAEPYRGAYTSGPDMPDSSRARRLSIPADDSPHRPRTSAP